MTSGVYAIVNRNGHCYIGSAVDLHKRWTGHRRDLRECVHHCGHLQKAWNKYGEPSFMFTRLEECPPQDCTRREQWWIDLLRPAYNVCQMATSPLGVRRSDATRAKISAAMMGRKRPLMIGKKMSPETKAKLSAAMTGRKHSAETRTKMTGRKHSAEAKAKMRLAWQIRRGV